MDLVTNLLGRTVKCPVWGNPPEEVTQGEIVYVREHDGVVLLGIKLFPTNIIQEQVASGTVLL